MHLLPIIHKTHLMLVYHLIVERKNLSLRIHLTFHLLFLEIQRVNILASLLCLCTIHQIMRMPTNILNFLIVAIMIFVILHLIMMLIHSLLIYLSHWSLMIYILIEWKPFWLSRYFCLGRWLCQVLVVLRLVPLPIRKFVKHSRLVITHLSTLKINPTHRFHFHYSNDMIPLLMH